MATPMRSDRRGGGVDEFKQRLRSYKTPVRRSPRFLPQINNNPVQISAKRQPISSKKPSANKTHLKSPQISATPTRIPTPKKTQQRCSTKCPREPLRPVGNLQRSSPAQNQTAKNTQRECLTKCPREALKPIESLQGSCDGKPLRRSPRLGSGTSTVEPVKVRRRSPRLMSQMEILEENKENVSAGVFSTEMGTANLSLGEAKQKLGIAGSKDYAEKGNGVKDGSLSLKRKRKMEVNCEEKVGGKKVERMESCGSCEWTEEQDQALQRAYLAAKPSPHFWKKVAKMVLF